MMRSFLIILIISMVMGSTSCGEKGKDVSPSPTENVNNNMNAEKQWGRFSLTYVFTIPVVFTLLTSTF